MVCGRLALMCSESALETAVGDWMPRVWMRQQQTVLLSVSDDDSIDYAVANAWCSPKRNMMMMSVGSL